jgi:hypothetical protein
MRTWEYCELITLWSYWGRWFRVMRERRLKQNLHTIRELWLLYGAERSNLSRVALEILPLLVTPAPATMGSLQ